jgi:macrolide glycosyltransferase
MWARPKRTERGRAYYARFRAWLGENGVTRHPDAFVGRPDRSIVLIPRALQPNADRVVESVYSLSAPARADRAAQATGGGRR